MSENAYWTVKAYNWDSQTKEFVLSEWISGITHGKADAYYKKMRETNEFSKLSMEKNTC
jgi:hypothetical protein